MGRYKDPWVATLLEVQHQAPAAANGTNDLGVIALFLSEESLQADDEHEEGGRDKVWGQRHADRWRASMAKKGKNVRNGECSLPLLSVKTPIETEIALQNNNAERDINIKMGMEMLPVQPCAHMTVANEMDMLLGRLRPVPHDVMASCLGNQGIQTVGEEMEILLGRRPPPICNAS
eukprot:gnl/TRDRNA2_/TRDRNA2_195075_c0_seq1.p1 gnl/TRDRNA2_/TRDRNA2_195075_c0~~gnl/TRDRNA2_/TRDRNA2_195075_c0_seq1.p1  ORF type:complete len:176 (-),score=25.80 gnl/TRDRNA2_/TRDRNA2_195075_c0_seq1:188-715(-)